MRLVLLAALSSLWACSALAQTSSLDASPYPPGAVVLSFEGGKPDEGITKALGIALAYKALPSETYVAQSGDNLCKVLVSRGFPKECGVQRIVQRLNPNQKLTSGRLSTGQRIELPQVRPRMYRTVRNFSPAQQALPSNASAYAKNWSNLSPTLRQGVGGPRIDLDAYEVILKPQTPEMQTKLLAELEQMRSANVLIDSVAFQPRASKLHQSFTEVSTKCAAGEIPPVTNYARLVKAADGDVLSILPSKRSDGVVQRPTVILLDVDLFAAPNIATTILGWTPTGPPPAWTRCAWGSAEAASHATHLAGIVASQENGYGFVGLAPEARLRSIKTFTPTGAAPDAVTPEPGVDLTISRLIYRNGVTGNFPLQIYLMAAVLKPLGAYPDTALKYGRFKPTYPRFDAAFERQVQQTSPLLIVSAGQEANADDVRQIAADLPMSPQNLGDQSGVVVVTACTECSKEDPTLLTTANYSPTGRFVHVAAPGGLPVPGWINNEKLGAAAGTSQAAAYVAGVAASMISHYPSNYTAAFEVKRRLQITSWPIYRQPSSANTDGDKLAAGIVDPNLTLLDPSKTWIKRGARWEAVALKGWSSDTLRFSTPTGAVKPIGTASLVRFVKVAPDPQPLWMLYSDRYQEDSANIPGEIGKLGPFTSASEGLLTPCTGAPIPLAAVDDLIVGSGGIGPDACL
jgi:hypothetical protein